MNTHTDHYSYIPRVRRLSLVAGMLVAAALTGGCVYRINIQQGNLLDADLIEQVEVGMTRTQIRFLLGTPLVSNPFDKDRWDYYYYFKAGKTREKTTQHFVVFFDGDQVSHFDRPGGEPLAEEASVTEASAAEASAEEASVTEASAAETSTGKAPAGKTSAGKTSTGKASGY
ncbi:MAG: outer membrane protein assembly factor BamE [Proteobacteria bacterium]|nr:outer membrane protein assembly factor BamE [Pseudomonadota bacterium]